jgi:acyl-CoA synthetase (NDP forming)
MIHAGGFLERGEAGAERQRELQRLCADARVPALGPNCLGFLSFTNRVSVSSFKISTGCAAGSIAAISQSGSVAALLQGIAGRHGLSFLASTGNEAVTGVEDLIAYAIEDSATRVIVAFVEGFRNPPELFELSKRAHAAGKPVILLKAGLTQHGGEVSRGHTGVIAGSGAVYRQALRQANFILVEDFDELAQTVELAASWGRALPKTYRVGMLGTSGGELGAVTDQCAEHRVTLPALAPQTLAALQGVLHLPADVIPRNPVDVGVGFNNPGSYEERMRGAIRAVASDPSVDVIAILQGFHRDSPDLAYSLNREILSATAKESSSIGKPILAMATRAGLADDEVLAEIRQANIPALEGSREALLAIRYLEIYSQRLAAHHVSNSSDWPRKDEEASTILKKLAADKDAVIGQVELFGILAEAGLPAPTMQRVESREHSEKIARDLGPKVVMKIDSGRVVHKSDVGGVALGVTLESAPQIYDKLLACLDPPTGTFPGEGIVAAAQIESGVELYIGAKRDESFGVVVAFGLGGRFLEILDLNAMLVAPFDVSDALEAIDRSGVRPFLEGYRAGPKADLEKLAGMIVSLGKLAAATGPRLEVLELNPVIINASHAGGVIADARLLFFREPRP